MNDDDMDQLIERGAKAYHEPGPIPREAMWERIQASRRAAPVVAVNPRRLPTWLGGAVAAAALLAVGIGVGRQLERRSKSPTPATVGATVKPPVEASGVAPVVAAHADSTSPAAGTSLENRLVLVEHLAGAEAMITAFRQSAKRGAVDQHMVDWSRETLTTTRMLEASSAASDPRMKRLLEDLDLIVTQIAHYSNTGTYRPDELDVIEHSISQRGVMTQLRTTIPQTTPHTTSPAPRAPSSGA